MPPCKTKTFQAKNLQLSLTTTPSLCLHRQNEGSSLSMGETNVIAGTRSKPQSQVRCRNSKSSAPTSLTPSASSTNCSTILWKVKSLLLSPQRTAQNVSHPKKTVQCNSHKKTIHLLSSIYRAFLPPQAALLPILSQDDQQGQPDHQNAYRSVRDRN